jgi:hypothetical protein
MNRRSLADRVEKLEKTVDDLREVATQVGAVAARIEEFDVQFVHLRGELRVEFSAMREEIQRGDEETRRFVREEIQRGDEEMRRFMRVLYEDLVARIAILGDRPQ